MYFVVLNDRTDRVVNDKIGCSSFSICWRNFFTEGGNRKINL